MYASGQSTVLNTSKSPNISGLEELETPNNLWSPEDEGEAKSEKSLSIKIQ